MGEDEDETSTRRTRVGIAIPATDGDPRARLHRLRAGARRAAAAVRLHRQVRAADRRCSTRPGSAGAAAIPAASWALLALLILSGLAALIAMTRAGIRTFWAPPDRAVPRVRVIEIAPIVAAAAPVRCC